MEDFNIRLGKRLRDLREQIGLTREKLAEMADTSPNYLGEIERGEVSVSATIVNRIAESLNLPLSTVYMLDHVRDRSELEADIIELVKSANDKDIEKIYRVLVGVLR